MTHTKTKKLTKTFKNNFVNFINFFQIIGFLAAIIWPVGLVLTVGGFIPPLIDVDAITFALIQGGLLFIAPLLHFYKMHHPEIFGCIDGKV